MRGRGPTRLGGCGTACPGSGASGDQLFAERLRCRTPLGFLRRRLWCCSRLTLRTPPACRRTLPRVAQREANVAGGRRMRVYVGQSAPQDLWHRRILKLFDCQQNRRGEQGRLVVDRDHFFGGRVPHPQEALPLHNGDLSAVPVVFCRRADELHVPEHRWCRAAREQRPQSRCLAVELPPLPGRRLFLFVASRAVRPRCRRHGALPCQRGRVAQPRSGPSRELARDGAAASAKLASRASAAQAPRAGVHFMYLAGGAGRTRTHEAAHLCGTWN